MNLWIATLLIATALGVLAALQAHNLKARAVDERPRTRAGRRARLRAEIAEQALLLPLAVGLFAVAGMLPPPALEHVSGKPVEVRSWSRMVVMPDGRRYIYCASGRKHCRDFDAWGRLPRWPEPNHVEMEVRGGELYSLRMDGKQIARRSPDDLRFGLIVIGLGMSIYAAVTILRRWLKLKKIPPPAPPRSPGPRDRPGPAGPPAPGAAGR